MAVEMAKRYNTEYVPEVSREIVSSNEFTLDDIIRIGRAQTERVLEKEKTAKRFLFCDTDLITTQIYSRQYLKQVPTVLGELEKKVKYDRYFLFDIDVPWVADGVRDLGDKRKEMFEVFRKELQSRGIPYVLVRGSFEERAEIVEKEILKLHGNA